MIRGWTRAELYTGIAALTLLPFLSLLQVGLNRMPEQREQQEITPFEKMPPDEYMMEYVGSIMLGGFRAIAVDFLWLRVDRLQKEKKWDEVRLVCEAIVRLQPHMSEVYAHLGWNMAYNISNLFESPEEKVKWIRAGLAYIESGQRKNMKDERLAFWLGYIYWHRIPRAEHMLTPPSEQRVLELIESQDQACAYETAIRYLMLGQRLYDEEMGAEAIYSDKYEGLIVDSMLHIAYHKMGDCWARPGIGNDPRRWDDVQIQLDETNRYMRYVDNRYAPGTTFWNDRFLFLSRLKRILEIERDAERIQKEEGLEAALPALWAMADDYKTQKSGKDLFRLGALERRLRGAILRICEAAYARLEAGNLAGARDLWNQVIVFAQTGMYEKDPYQVAWKNWGEGLRRLAGTFPAEAKALQAMKAGNPGAAAAPAAEAYAVYVLTMDENGLIEMPLFQKRAETLKKMAGK